MSGADRRETGAPPDPLEWWRSECHHRWLDDGQPRVKCQTCGLRGPEVRAAPVAGSASPDLTDFHGNGPAPFKPVVGKALAPVVVAGSASFSALLDALVVAASHVTYGDGYAVVGAARARVESLHRDEVKRLTTALRDLLESVDLIEAHFDKYGMAGDVIRGFLLGANDRARAVLGARPVNDATKEE